jgi:phosphoribosylformimino-5-aminoimidazole carboxamide ribotide isomerase
VILYPAIDIRGGRAVRLLRGDFGRETVYDADAVEAGRRWAEAGAEALHVVDLDGARAGHPVNLEPVRRIVAAVPVPVQLGGGLRDESAVREALATGVERVVLGTKAQEDPELVAGLAREHGERIVAAVDARDGLVSVAGWNRATETDPAELLGRLSDLGLRRFTYTPVEVDGTMEGPALDELRRIGKALQGELIYSGGIGTLEDLRVLAGLRLPSLAGAIVGRALYEGRFTVAEAQDALSGSGNSIG